MNGGFLMVQVQVNDTLYTQSGSNHYIIGVKNKKKLYSELHDRDLTKEELQRYGMKIEEQLALNTKEDAERA